MNLLKSTGLLATTIGLLASGCVCLETDPHVIVETGDLEVRVHTPSGFAIEGAEITLYPSYDAAMDGYDAVGLGYTNRYGKVFFYELPVGKTVWVRAQGAETFSLGSVYIEHPGLWILPMELI